jgi:hypothetical protein
MASPDKQDQCLRINHSVDITLLKTLFGLIEEVEQLRSELRFLRMH